MTEQSATYYRILNLGNYENKRLERFREIKEHEDPTTVTRQLMLEVEQLIREDVEKEIVQHIENLKAQEREFRQEVTRLKTEIEQLRAEKAQLQVEPNSIQDTSADDTSSTAF